MYKEMEQVRQADEVIDLKKKEQEFEQKFKPAGMFANIWVQMFRMSTAGRLTSEDLDILRQAQATIVDRMNERIVKIQNQTQVVEGIPAANWKSVWRAVPTPKIKIGERELSD